jgi:hypothetical protein
MYPGRRCARHGLPTPRAFSACFPAATGAKTTVYQVSATLWSGLEDTELKMLRLERRARSAARGKRRSRATPGRNRSLIDRVLWVGEGC